MSNIHRFAITVGILLLTAVALAPTNSTAAAPDLSTELASCSAVLVPSELLRTHDNNTDEAFFDAMCGSWYNNHRQVIDSALGGSAIIEAVPVSGSATNTTTNTTLSRTQYCSQAEHRVSQRTKDIFWSRLVPDSARTAWVACVNAITNRPTIPHLIRIGLQPVGEQQVTMSVLYDANLGGEQPTFTGIEATNLSCVDNTAGARPPIPSLGAGLAFNCQWTSAAADVGAVIVKTSRGDEIASISRVLPPYLTVAEELHTPVTITARTTTVCGAWFGTTDMHEWHKDGNHDGRCTKASDDGKWCKGNYGQTVTAQSGGLLKNARFECRGEACGWNDIPRHQFWFTPTSGVTSISGETWAGSRSVDLRLCADEDVPGTQDQVTRPNAWILARGGSFVVDVPVNSRAVLNIQLANGNASVLDVGNSNAILSLVEKTTVGSITKWSYRVNP